MSLSGNKVVVVGADGDIGRAVIERLAELGAIVVLGTHKACDVTSTESVRSFLGLAWLAKRNGFEGLVNCHGALGCIKSTLELTDGEFQHVVDVDLTGTLRTCREAARYMLAVGGGSIVNLSSIHALAAYPQRAAYAAAKAGVVGLTRALAIEWAHRGLRVNAVLPGQVESTRRTTPHERLRAYERSPSGVFVQPEAVAAAICYLLEAPGVNGHSLVVDDGWTASAWYGAHDEKT